MIRERVVNGERIVTVDTEEELAQAIARRDVTVEAPPEIVEAFGVFPEDVGSEEDIDAAREELALSAIPSPPEEIVAGVSPMESGYSWFLYD